MIKYIAIFNIILAITSQFQSYENIVTYIIVLWLGILIQALHIDKLAGK
jgi:hypothetical protein